MVADALEPAADQACAQTSPQPVDHGLCIVVADRGHVWVGRAFETYDGWVKIEDARIVRRWGTSDGLNQLARQGPQPQTQLDAPATVKVSHRAVLYLVPCEESAWPKSA